VLQLFGGLFILYLAREAYITWRAAAAMQPVISTSAGQSFLKAVVVNFLSPAPYIFWSTITGPMFIEGWQQSPSVGISFVVGFYSGFVGLLAGIVILFATASRYGPRFRHTLNGIAVIALLLFGLYQLWSGVTDLL
jgi:threonine/homoserine/homoserine lactone efflux protein